MTNIWEKAISILAGNLITTVLQMTIFYEYIWGMSWVTWFICQLKNSEHMVITQDIVNLVTESVKEDAKKLRGGVIFADHLPKNPQGKLLRRKLLELYEENIITNSNTIKVSW